MAPWILGFSRLARLQHEQATPRSGDGRREEGVRSQCLRSNSDMDIRRTGRRRSICTRAGRRGPGERDMGTFRTRHFGLWRVARVSPLQQDLLPTSKRSPVLHAAITAVGEQARIRKALSAKSKRLKFWEEDLMGVYKRGTFGGSNSGFKGKSFVKARRPIPRRWPER